MSLDGGGKLASDSPSPPAGPVFIHSSWRTCKTWLWAKFRKFPTAVCFYEPHGEHCAKLSQPKIASFNSREWASRHPREVGPYFTEYLPLVGQAGEKGLPGYREAFALRSYLRDADSSPDEIGEAEISYLASLIASASTSVRGGRAVFGCARTMGRIGFLKRRLGGQHLVLVRDPYKQWLSIADQWRKHRNPYFAATYLMIVGCGRRHPFLGALASRFGIPEIQGDDFEQEMNGYQALCETVPPARLYEIFLRVQTASYLAGFASADLILDADQLAESAGLQTSAAREIAALTGFAPTLADCRPTHTSIGPDDEENLATTETVRREVEAGTFGFAVSEASDTSAPARQQALSLLAQTAETIRAVPLPPALFRQLSETAQAELLAARLEAARHSLEFQTVQTKLQRLRAAWTRQFRAASPPRRTVVTTSPSRPQPIRPA